MLEDFGWIAILVILLALTGSCGFKGCTIVVDGVPHTISVHTE